MRCPATECDAPLLHARMADGGAKKTAALGSRRWPLRAAVGSSPGELVVLSWLVAAVLDGPRMRPSFSDLVARGLISSVDEAHTITELGAELVEYLGNRRHAPAIFQRDSLALVSIHQ